MKELVYKNTKLMIIKGDITKVKTEAIVNAAKNTLLGGTGVDGAIHEAGGSEILEQCKKIGGCPTGEARITVAGNLEANYIIHTVGPIYIDGKSNEPELLYNAYYNSLKLGKKYNIKSISFPAISTGIYGYPKIDAVKIALNTAIEFIDKNLDVYKEIVFVSYSDSDFDIYEKYFDKIIS